MASSGRRRIGASIERVVTPAIVPLATGILGRAMRCAALCVTFTGCAVLTACGGSGSPPTPSPSASTSPGAFSSQSFNTVIPRDWTDETGNQSAAATINVSGNVEMLIFAPGTTSNEHIDVTVTPQPVPDDQIATYLQSVSQNGAVNLSSPQPFTIDRSSGVYITYNVTAKTGGINQEQDMVINHGGNTYDIVLNAAQARFNTLLPALQQVLGAWKWSG
jgi:hypothetical protein